MWNQLEASAREKVQVFLQQELEEEVDALLGRQTSERRTPESPVGYRNGYGKPRQLALTNGTITLRRPRVRDLDERFESRVLPCFKRRTKEVGAVLPELYLHGLALGDFELALRGLLGDSAPLSASSILRRTAGWQAQFAAWRQRDLSELELVYLWADGLYVKAGLEDTKAALLVMVGGLADGRKVIVAVESGQRESTESWAAVLRDLKARGLRAPKLTVGDGHLGLWGALGQLYPASAEQRCWNHKLRNILDAVPEKAQLEVKAALQAIASAASRAAAERGKRAFRLAYAKRLPKAVERRERDWERMVTYYTFPTAHWRHLDREHHRVAVRRGPAPHLGRQAIQEGRQRRGNDLAVTLGRRAAFPEVERPGTVSGCVREQDLHGWRTRDRSTPDGSDVPKRACRLTLLFTHLLTRPRITL